jgi:hypothetical protein
MNARGRGNHVRRRFRLASELVEQVPWLHRAAVPRVAWVIRRVADAGWTAAEVIAWLHLLESPARVHRPSGLLARRLRGAEEVWPTAAGRAAAVEADRDSPRSARERRAEFASTCAAPGWAVEALRHGLAEGRRRFAQRSGEVDEWVELAEELPSAYVEVARSSPQWALAQRAFSRLLGEDVVRRVLA